ncbi:MAG: Cof-type HAD-IIB family hydrolase [Enterocloster aldenensis]|nr:Cof-type HAD-IIB family hydrolase [Enterocloster aldenensis]MDY4531755.1 Cof-type HAD-IIB family hydrolase [Enterocloster aldenensis]
MKYKLLVLDIDGTLTNEKKEITRHTKQTILRMQKAGVKVVLASGRPAYGVEPTARELELEQYGGFILSYNGGRIVDCSTGRTIYEKTIPHKLMGGIYGQVHDLNAALMTYEGDRIITEKPQDAYVAKESFINKMKVKGVGNFLDYVTFPVVKCLVAADGGYLETVEDKLVGYFGSQLSIFRSEPYFLEIMPKDIDKASSLERLCLQLGLERAEIAACGDGLNDISMIQYAGLGIAMANAQEAVKRVCDFVTKSNEEEGVAYAIDRFILG